MKIHRLLIPLTIAFLVLAPAARLQAQFNLLYSFTKGPSEGNTPYGTLAASGSTLYGQGYFGGSNNYGAVFSIQTDGTAYTTLHSFAGGVSDGASPNGSLTLMSSVLYGMTEAGGSYGAGTLFQINTNGEGFRILHSFTGSDGSVPRGALCVSGSVLYGITLAGGSTGGGTVFKLNTDGTGFVTLHNFPGNSFPEGALTLSGAGLYGTTSGGGTSGQGSLFRIGTDGTGYTVLHNFGGYPVDGSIPSAVLTLSGSTLYGTTAEGGSSNVGTVFEINTDGTGYSVLHSFSGSDGWGVWGNSLAIIGSTLYGMATSGGSGGQGVVFKMNTDGSGFSNLHNFALQNADGQYPYSAGLTFSGGVFYGLTTAGGANTVGTMFKISPDGNTYATLHSFSVGVSDGSRPRGSLTWSGSAFYGTTFDGGAQNFGVVFQIGTNGAGYTVRHSFAGFSPDGGNPMGSLVLSGSHLYGATPRWYGMVFVLETNGTGFNVLRQSDSTAGTDDGSLVLSGSVLYGTAVSGGPGDFGVVFKINTDGTGFQVLHTFQGGPGDGAIPGDVTLVSSTLYGTTQQGGSTNSFGTVFKIETDGSGYEILHVFHGGADDGSMPIAGLTYDGTMLYGTTQLGGTNNLGALFAIRTDGNLYTNLHSFGGAPNDGSYPADSVIVSDSTVYGMTSSGGSNNLGTVFRVQTDGTGFTVLRSFLGGASDGSSPLGSLTLVGSTLYGMTEYAGEHNSGILFSLPSWVLGAVPDTNIDEQVLWAYTPGVNCSSCTFGLSNAPAGMAVDSTSGTISWTPAQTQATFTFSNIIYVVYQSGRPIASTNFNVTVNDINVAPELFVPGMQTVYATTAMTVTNTAIESDIWATSLTFALVAPPSGAAIDPTTGVITWVPMTAEVGTNTITVTVTDTDPYAVNALNLTTTGSFLVIVRGPSPPSFLQTPTNEVVGFGEGFAFNSLADGSPPPAYQWQFSPDGVNYANLGGATDANYERAASTLADIGYYRVVVANLLGTNTSPSASLSFLNVKLLPALILYGPTGANYTIQSEPALAGSSNWTSLIDITLPLAQPFIYVDPSSLTNSKEFYRAVPR